jgi:hypothetical protein
VQASYNLDSFNKWPPGTAAKLTLAQITGYMEAMRLLLGSKEDDNEPEDPNAVLQAFID